MSTFGGTTPLPENVMVRGLPTVLSHSARVFACVPSVVGLNEAVIVHDVLVAQEDPSVHVVLQANEPLEQIPGPVQLSSRSELTPYGPVPVDITVTVDEPLERPTTMSPKLIDVGSTVTPGTGSVVAGACIDSSEVSSGAYSGGSLSRGNMRVA